MNFSHIGTIFRKELREALRDRRTILSAILIPMVLFPIVTLGFGFMAAHSFRKVRQEGASIMVLGAEEGPALFLALRKTEGLTIVPSATHFGERIADKKLRAAIELPPGFQKRMEEANGERPVVKIYSYTGEIRSQFAVQAIQKTLREYADSLVAARLEKAALSPALLKPFATKEENVAPPEKVGGNALGGLIPYMIIFLCFVGAMTPAMDITAGEKERGTIETILATPVGRTELVCGKFLLVLAVSMVTSIIALASFALSFSLPFAWARELSRMGPNSVPFDISITAVLSVFLLVAPVAVMFSSGMLAVSSFAKSSKEAQSYISPLMMLVILPAMAGLLPGYDLSWRLALVPILNVTLVSKELLTGIHNWGLISLVFISSCVYAAIALGAAVLIFRQESVLFRT